MKKILIISYLFAPDNQIGSIRPTKLAKYWSANGFRVDVITKNHNSVVYDNSIDERDLHAIHKIITIDHSSDFKKRYQKFVPPTNKLTLKKDFPVKRKSKARSLLSFTYRQMLDFYRSFDFYKQFKLYILRNMASLHEYDIIFSSYGPLSSLLCGYCVKKYFPKICWVSDFRDPLITESTPFLFRPLLSLIQNKTCNTADILTTVSKGYKKRIFNNKFINKSWLMTNGYDEGDNLNGSAGHNFSFVYVGSLYEGKRDLSPLFSVLNGLVDEDAIDVNNLVFKYAGNDFSFLYSQALAFNMHHILQNYGHLGRDSCLQLQFSARFLVLSTWNSTGEEGVFPGKFLEYMLINKPIISIGDGNLPNSEVTQVMEEAHLGVSYESIRHDVDFAILKDYIKSEYKRFKQGLEPNFVPKNEVLERYNYRNIAKQFEELFNQC